MDKRNRLSISFKREYQHIFDHLLKIPNKSDYIAKAVEKYMQEDQPRTSHEEIRKIVLEVLTTHGNIPHLPQFPSPLDALISEEDLTLIADLF